MRMTVRRYRRRRTGGDSPGFTQALYPPPLFDRLEFLSQSIRQTRKTDAPFLVLVTRDNYLRVGLLQGQSLLNQCLDYETLDEALGAASHWPSARLLVDIDSRTTTLIEMLDALRRQSLYAPFLTPHLLIRADDYDARLFCKAAGPFHVMERQLTAQALQHALLEPPAAAPSRNEWFSRHEWPLLQLLAQGKSLREIALLQNHPYSRIIYRLGCILKKQGLSHRQELFHLLTHLTEFTF